MSFPSLSLVVFMYVDVQVCCIIGVRLVLCTTSFELATCKRRKIGAREKKVIKIIVATQTFCYSFCVSMFI
jgi:hypothetical protein